MLLYCQWNHLLCLLVNWILPGLFFPLNGNVCPTDGMKKGATKNLRDPRKLKHEAFYHARTLAANVTNGNQISHSLSWSTDCCNYIKFRTGVGCRVWQGIQVKKYISAPAFTTSAVLSPFFSPPHLPPVLFTGELKSGWMSFLPVQCYKRERNQSSWIPTATEMEEEEKKILFSNDSCTAPWTHLPLVMDLCNHFAAVLAGRCFSGRASYTDFPTSRSE